MSLGRYDDYASVHLCSARDKQGMFVPDYEEEMTCFYLLKVLIYFVVYCIVLCLRYGHY